MSSVRLNDMTVCGWLGERFDRAIKAFENLRSAIWWDCSRVWGYNLPFTWLRNMSLVSRYTGEIDPAVPELAERLLELHRQGKLELDYTKLRIGVWIDGELIFALLEYWRVSHDERALEAAREVGRRILANHESTSHYYTAMAIPHLLSLADATGDASFRDLAIKLAERHGLEVLRLDEGAHGAAVSMILDAYLDLHRATGERRCLDWAVEGWRATRDRTFVTGGMGEVLYFRSPPSEAMLQDETCQVSWWLVLNLHLWRATGEGAYLDTAERILYNHFAFRQLHRGEGGGFCAMGDVDQGFRGDHNYFCCDGEGLFAFLRLLPCIYSQETGKPVLSVNLLIDSEVRVALAGAGMVVVRQATAYPERGVASFTVEARQPARFELRVRIPCGSRATEVLVNGDHVVHGIEGAYVSIDREWRDGDVAAVVFPIPMSIEADNTGRDLRSADVAVNGQAQPAKRLAVLHGPVVAAIFRTGHANDLSWIWTGDYPEALDSGGSAADDYPGSRPDLLELDGETRSTGLPADHTAAACDRSVPSLTWNAALGDQVRTRHELRVLPGLPVTIEDREEITGWDGRGRLLCSGLRFATLKTAATTYGTISWPYPSPCVTTKPDLSDTRSLVKQAGTFGLYEKLEHGSELGRTGTVVLNNGYFGAIELYDPQPVKAVTCRREKNWVGVYLEPEAVAKIVLSRRLVFPLASTPMSQTTARMVAEKSAQVEAKVTAGADGDLQLTLSGPVLRGAPILIPKTTGLKPGWIVSCPTMASYVWDYDAEHVMVQVDTPGTYRVVCC